MGAGVCSSETASLAEEVGRRLAEAGAVLICGGLGGVMEAVARGARAAGGVTIGILPGASRADANPFIDIAIVTGMGYARNAVIARSADAILALPGEYGTLSEIALALKMGTPVVALRSWEYIPGVEVVQTPEEAAGRVLARARRP